MKALDEAEVEEISGGLTTTEAAGMTISLMALAPASVAVLTAGMVALAFYGVSWLYRGDNRMEPAAAPP